MFNKAILLYTNGDMYSAIPHFSFVLEKAKYTDYRYKLSLYFIARIYEVNGKIDEALEYYNRLLDVAPYFMEARFRLYHIYKNLGDFQRAKKHIEIAISKYPEFLLAKIEYIKFLYENLKDYNLAYEECKKFLNDNPDNPIVNFIAGDILYRFGEKRIAIKYYSRYLNSKQYRNSYWEYRAIRGIYEGLLERGDYEKARLYERWVKPTGRNSS
jgi:tetratricopeptide (TPR) repeat protein